MFVKQFLIMFLKTNKLSSNIKVFNSSAFLQPNTIIRFLFTYTKLSYLPKHLFLQLNKATTINFKMIRLKKFSLIFLIACFFFSCSNKEKKILVFSKTEGFRHTSIESGIEAIKKLGVENKFKVVTTEDAAYFIEDSLKQYSTVLFLNTTGDVLNHVQQADFERYIQAGGGFMGIHSAADTEYDWPWYNKLIGAYFESHPNTQKATLNIVNKNHPSTKTLDSTWIKTDEWYNFKNINPDINVLIQIDENTYEGGKNGENHPISWYHDYDGGRAFYTEMGHTDETYKNLKFLNHINEGIKYCIGNNKLNYNKAKTKRIPKENRFVKKVLDFNLDEPMELDELPGRGIIFIERKGAIKLYDFKSEQTTTISQFNVHAGDEDGLLGVAADPNFKKNNWIYLFYSALGKTREQHVARFTLTGNTLDLNSKKIILKIPTIEGCCHSAGSLEFDSNGNLFIAVGDNTSPFESSGFSPIDERKGRELWDAQKSASNTNDLRGKILRIKPKNDGTYSIPEGNLFPEGTPNTKPEIYVMGCRNPFRISVDSKTGFVYWGDIGPDAGNNDENRGPKGLGEFDQARKPGFWGWPYTRGNNQPYIDYDFETNQSSAKFNPKHLTNNSPNNTGLKELPPSQESLIWYSYDESSEFPWLGKGGVNPMAGPVFHNSDHPNASNIFPDYFENKLFVYEWMRDWIYVVTLDKNYNYVNADPFMPSTEFSHPMDMLFGSDGSLYILEYGQKWFSKNLDARLSKVSFVRGNRRPIAKISTSQIVGSSPLKVIFSGAESEDYDNDKLKYEWSFTEDKIQSTEVNPTFTFNKNGSYTVKLKVIDSNGETSIAQTKILVGNDAPKVNIKIDSDNLFYSDNKKVNYTVSIIDNQDGSTAKGTIDLDKVKITLDYIPEGQDMVKATVGHQQNTIPAGKRIIDANDCRACHATNEKVNGPSYIQIANKYTKNDLNSLIDKIKNGSSGVWGETMMSPHPQLNEEELNKIVTYILELKQDKTLIKKSLPLNGTIEFKEHKGKENKGVYVLIASYLDNGIDDEPESKLSSSEKLIFTAPKKD